MSFKKITVGDATLYLGDCLQTLRTLPDNSVDAIVTDPPYGLSFMGKRWDYDVPGVDVWAECLRVLKPGGHLLAFAGTRTQHRMAVRIEDAGFEIRDMIAWVYGSGFPKSLDVSKAIDKMDAAEEQERRRLAFTAWVRSQGVTSRQIDAATGTNMGGHYTTAASQPAIMTREHLEACRHLFSDVPEWVVREADQRTVESENFKRREVVGVKEMTDTAIASPARAWSAQGIDSAPRREVALTVAHTEAAKQWQGWGTALKPALEPITVARKPLVGTVAENVLEHGTGALNIDGCRVAAQQGDEPLRWEHGRGMGFHGAENRGPCEALTSPGRWPANLIHDGSDEVLAGFPHTTSGAMKRTVEAYAGDGVTSMLRGRSGPQNQHGDAGSAARFFYCAKASKRDRDEGLDEFEKHVISVTDGHGRGAISTSKGGDGVLENRPRANTHPTVKPTDLMAYLCRLVTPPGGVVLDPFMGSGSTGKAAMLEGFRFIGCELSPEYLAIAEARIRAAVPSLKNKDAEGEPSPAIRDLFDEAA